MWNLVLVDFLIHVLITLVGLYAFYVPFGIPRLKKSANRRVKNLQSLIENRPTIEKRALSIAIFIAYNKRDWLKHPPRNELESRIRCAFGPTRRWNQKHMPGCAYFQPGGPKKVGETCENDDECETSYCVGRGFDRDTGKYYRDRDEAKKLKFKGKHVLHDGHCMLDCYSATRDGEFGCRPDDDDTYFTDSEKNSNMKVVLLSYAVALPFLGFIFFDKDFKLGSWLKHGLLLMLAVVLGEFIFFELYFSSVQLTDRRVIKNLLDQFIKESPEQ